LNRFTLIPALTLILVSHSALDAQLGLQNFGPRVGKDVVSGDDTRTFWMFQADIAQLWSPRILLEVAAETGSGRDLQGENVEVAGVSTIFKYYWVNKKKNAYAFSGGGFGVNRYRRFFGGEFRTETDTSIHFVLVGMERHVFQKKAKGVLDIRWLIGNVEGASALRVGLGVSYLLKSP
jgi:hypothetical protein